MPPGSVVKWSEWERYTEPETGIEWVQYTVRATDPLPEEAVTNLSEATLVDAHRSFFTVLPITDDGTESVPISTPFRTFGFRVRADKFFANDSQA